MTYAKNQLQSPGSDKKRRESNHIKIDIDVHNNLIPEKVAVF